MSTNERRFTADTKIELRAAADGKGPGTVVGRAIVYNSRSEKLFGKFYERIKPGAFDRSFGQKRMRLNFEHIQHATLGTERAGTLRVNPGPEGVDFECDLPDTTFGRDAAALIERGDLAGCSFEFREAKWEWRDLDDDEVEGDVVEGTVDNLTLTVNPAYPETTTALRSLDEAKGEDEPAPNTDDGREARLRLAEAEQELREFG